jgi:hypothetical protein
MAPEIEWQVKDEAGQQTVMKTQRRPPSRWKRFALLLVILIGAGLGIAYSNTPASTLPAPDPTPLPTSKPPAPPLAETIDEEALALAQGDRSAFEALLDPIDTRWVQAQLSTFKAWGQPASTGQLYEVIASGTLSFDRAWADVIQFRAGQYFRETRFYRLQNARWYRTAPDLSLWGEAQQLQTAHFEVNFRSGDEPVVPIVADYFERTYTLLCVNLGCPRTTDGLVPRAISITLDFQPETSQVIIANNGALFFRMPSPRLMGLYYQSLNADEAILGNNVQLERLVTNGLIGSAARVAAGMAQTDRAVAGGNVFINAIVGWEYTRLQGGDTQTDTLANLEAINAQPLLPLPSLWAFGSGDTSERVQIESSSVVVYIEQTFGPQAVLNFLHAIGPSASLAEAIESSLHLNYADFEQNWQGWLKQFGVRVSR